MYIKSKRIRKIVKAFGRSIPEPEVRYPKDYTSDDIQIIKAVIPFTMVNHERLHAVINAARYVVRNQIPGSIIECGVWKGGCIAAAGLALKLMGESRDFWLFDTFEGMSKPSEKDRNFSGKQAGHLFQQAQLTDDSSIWCRCEIDDVKYNLIQLGLEPEEMKFVKGKVEETLVTDCPKAPIALLRLDTDWYESTKAEMEHLFPLLSRGGVLIVDDYGTWQGAREAVDEYMNRNQINMLLQRIGGGSVVGIKG